MKKKIRPSDALIRAYDNLAAAAGGVVEARSILRATLEPYRADFGLTASAAESVARQADGLAAAARAYAAALRKERR